MAGNKEGAAKARETIKKKYGENFFKEIGAKGWKNPNRSRKTGFALLPKDVVVELGRKGGQQNKGKKHGKAEEFTTPEEIHALLEEDQTSDGPNSSE